MFPPREAAAPGIRGGRGGPWKSASVAEADDILRRRALLALHDVELHLLSFRQRAEPFPWMALWCTKQSLPPSCGRDEPEALLVVEPLDGPGGTHPDRTPSRVTGALGDGLAVPRDRSPTLRGPSAPRPGGRAMQRSPGESPGPLNFTGLRMCRRCSPQANIGPGVGVVKRIRRPLRRGSVGRVPDAVTPRSRRYDPARAQSAIHGGHHLGWRDAGLRYFPASSRDASAVAV
jgi:hypothetical protein